VEWLKVKALSSNPSIAKTTKKTHCKHICKCQNESLLPDTINKKKCIGVKAVEY
jgi:hypothetical protein